VLNDMSPPESPGSATAVEAAGLPAVMIAEDEAGSLRAQLEAIQEAMARLEWEAASTATSHLEA
jgi:hypothetical protein